MKGHIFELRRKIWFMIDHRSYTHNVSSYVIHVQCKSLKQKIVHSSGSFNIDLGILIFSFNVYRA